MDQDEQAIRALVEAWLAASQAGDLAAILRLMSEDALFMVPGQEPFGKDAFAASFRELRQVDLKAVSEIREIQIAGKWAWTRNRLSVTITPPAGKPVMRTGYTLSILHKEPDGRWVIHRDANLLGAG